MFLGKTQVYKWVSVSYEDNMAKCHQCPRSYITGNSRIFGLNRSEIKGIGTSTTNKNFL